MANDDGLLSMKYGPPQTQGTLGSLAFQNVVSSSKRRASPWHVSSKCWADVYSSLSGEILTIAHLAKQ